MIIFLLMLLFGFMPEYSFSGKCDFPWQRDSAGRKCGGRAASCRPGGSLGGDGPGCPKTQRPLKIDRENNSCQKEIDRLKRELAKEDSLKRELLAEIAGLKKQLKKTKETAAISGPK